MVYQPSKKSTAYTDFEKELIKVVPSNLYLSKLLVRPASSISTMRKKIPEAVKSRKFKLLKTVKREFYPIVKDVCIKYTHPVNDPSLNTKEKILALSLIGKMYLSKKKYEKKKIKVFSSNIDSSLSIPISINGQTVVISQNDKIITEGGKIIIESRRIF